MPIVQVRAVGSKAANVLVLPLRRKEMAGVDLGKASPTTMH